MTKQETIISNRIIRKLNPCYDPSDVVKDENEELPVKEWVLKYRDLVKKKSDIIWLLCNKLYMSERDIRLFAVWCAREALKLVNSPDERSITACNVAEMYANGEATIEELTTARENAWLAAWNDTWDDTLAAQATARHSTLAARAATLDVASVAVFETSWEAALAAAWEAASDARATALDAQINKLMSYFD